MNDRSFSLSSTVAVGFLSAAAGVFGAGFLLAAAGFFGGVFARVFAAGFLSAATGFFGGVFAAGFLPPVGFLPATAGVLAPFPPDGFSDVV